MLKMITRVMPLTLVAILTGVAGTFQTAGGQLLAAERGNTAQRYILGGENLTVRDALTVVAEQAGVRPPRWPEAP